FRLRKHQGIGIRALDRTHRDAANHLVTGKEADGINLESPFDEWRGTARLTVQQFEGPTPEHNGLRLVGAVRRPLEDAHRYAVACELDCQRQADRTGPYDENVLGHRLPLQLGASAGVRRALARLEQVRLERRIVDTRMITQELSARTVAVAPARGRPFPFNTTAAHVFLAG